MVAAVRNQASENSTYNIHEMNGSDSYQNAWDIFESKIAKSGTQSWLIKEDLSGRTFKELYEGKLQKPTFYKGAFRVFGFTNYPNGSLVKFIMTKNDILVGHIKHEIARISNANQAGMEISFHGKILADEDDFITRCSWNGWGGEIFQLNYREFPVL